MCKGKNAQVKVVKKKRAVFAAEGRKDECCLFRFVQKFLPLSHPPIFQAGIRSASFLPPVSLPI